MRLPLAFGALVSHLSRVGLRRRPSLLMITHFAAFYLLIRPQSQATRVFAGAATAS
jgi:hypothetical protein